MTKENPYERDDGYLNVKLLKQEIKQFAFLVGNRNIGKTYGWLIDSIEEGLETVRKRFSLQDIKNLAKMPDFVDAEYQFFWLRRTIPQAKAAARRLILDDFLVKFKADIDSNILEAYNFEIEYQGDSEAVRDIILLLKNKAKKKDKKRIRFGYISALSAADKIRGPGIPTVKWIIYDEFQARKHWDYLPNEVSDLLDIYDSIARERAGTKDCRLAALGNSGSILNPFFDYYDYEEFDQIRTDKKNGTVIFYHFENEAKRTQMYNDSISGTTYESYAVKNQYPDNQDFNILKLQHATKPRNTLYNVVLGKKTFGVWRDGDKRVILSKITNPEKKTFVEGVARGDQISDLQIFHVLASSLKFKQLYFDSPEIILHAEKCLRKYLYRNESNDWKSA